MRNDANNMFKGLKLTTKSNEVFSVEIEPGKPLSGIQNVILLISGLNKEKTKKLLLPSNKYYRSHSLG
ncbi:MAG TPA: hypothetical protein PLH43_04925 [Acetivibrio sp.]|nr:hypothetical protein [Acetivibrio sp.]